MFEMIDIQPKSCMHACMTPMQRAGKCMPHANGIKIIQNYNLNYEIDRWLLFVATYARNFWKVTNLIFGALQSRS